MKKRTIEVFTAGCPFCDDTVDMVKNLAGDSDDVQVLDMRDSSVYLRALQYGIRRVPTIVVEGQVADCCKSVPCEASILIGMGVGSPLH